MMTSTPTTAHRPSSAERKRQLLLDAATDVLTTEPGASLGVVAQAAHVSRTTLHNYFASREDLLRAVGDRALELCARVVTTVGDTTTDDDGGVRALVVALLSVGPHLAFLWRTPSFDHEPDFGRRWLLAEKGMADIIGRAKARGVVSTGRPDWWDVSTLLALIYVASESIYLGRLASLDAPDLVLRTFLT
jgi:TetR/AcrR family transcriptional repressor of lfrA